MAKYRVFGFKVWTNVWFAMDFIAVDEEDAMRQAIKSGYYGEYGHVEEVEQGEIKCYIS